jgi:hypothetical protein
MPRRRECDKDYIPGPTAWRLSRRYGRTLLGPFFHHYLQDLSATLGETSRAPRPKSRRPPARSPPRWRAECSYAKNGTFGVA